MYLSKWAVGVITTLLGGVIIGLFTIVIMLVAQGAPGTGNDVAMVESIAQPTTIIQNGTQLTAADIATICQASAPGSWGSSAGWTLGNSQIGDNAQIWSNVIINAPVSASTGGHNNNQANSIVGSNSPGASAIGGNTSQTANGQQAATPSTTVVSNPTQGTTVTTIAVSTPSTSPSTTTVN